MFARILSGLSRCVPMYLAFLLLYLLTEFTVGTTGYWRDDLYYMLPDFWVGSESRHNGHMAFFVIWSLIDIVILMFLATVIAVLLSGSNRDLECRCRKCGYVLRGLSEPTCPECGEAV